jgi:hypothetical protein
MIEVVNTRTGTIVWSGEDPVDALAVVALVDGFDPEEGRTIEQRHSDLLLRRDDGRAIKWPKDAEEKAKGRKPKFDRKAAEAGPLVEQLIVNAATGEIEQRIEGSGKIEIADPADPDGKRTIEVTAAQLRDLSLKRSIEHMAESHERVLADHDRTADLTASALAEVMREAEDAGERLDPAEALSRAQDKLPDAEPAATDPPSEVRHDGEAVKLTIEKAG